MMEIAKMGDYEFLKEIKQHLSQGINHNDPSELQYALKMIEDWIDEFEEK
jgi:predicted metalloprotease with PDZ domain